MSRLHEMKSLGLDKVKAVYSRSSFFGKDKTMAEVVEDIIANAYVSGREHTSKSKVKTWKATMKV
jgi:hypothetical protein